MGGSTQQSTTLRMILKQGTKSNPNTQFQDQNLVPKTSKHRTFFNAQLCRTSIFHIKCCVVAAVQCVIARSHARCFVAARNHNKQSCRCV